MPGHIVIIGVLVIGLILAAIFISRLFKKPLEVRPTITISTGTSLDFDRVKKPSQDNWLRTLSIAVENGGTGPASNCLLAVEWNGDAGAKKSHPIADKFILLPAKKRFFPLASYNEAQATSAESRRIVLQVEKSGQDGHTLSPQASKKHLVTVRLTCPEITAPTEFSCSLYVDGAGRFRLEKV